MGFRKLKKSTESTITEVNGFISSHNQTNYYTAQDYSILDIDSCNFLIENIKKPFERLVQLEQKAMELSESKLEKM